MAMNIRKYYIISSVITVSLFLLWLYQPVKMIFSERNIGLDLVVEHFPLSDQGRISWFLKHRQEIEDKYNTSGEPFYSITIWDIGDGFKTLDHNTHDDLYCFNQIKVKDNCIEKNILLNVSFYNGGVYFSPDGGNYKYRLDKNGNVEEFTEENKIIVY
ncbi:DUF943 family protein [Salmonella enterica]|nr:DUF943 family protein [Salmonella enterica]EBQ2136655.1 DUF943 family protein [Salmonella enterica]EHS6105754.1 DUF943 family protein [Salmonella enterica]